MKKIISVILAVCLVLTAFPLIASANTSDPGPAALQKRVFFADYAGQFSYAYLFCWEMDNNYFIDVPYEWPGIMMEQVDSNENGDVMYSAVMPYNVNYIIINDNGGKQTVEIPLGERTLITLTGEVDDSLYYKVNVEEISCDEQDPTLPDDGSTHPTLPTDPQIGEENLIVIDNAIGTFDFDIYICCRTGDNNGEEATLRAKMECFDINGYSEGMYRFSIPEGMEYFYITDNKKRTVEEKYDPCERSIHLYLLGFVDKNGDYEISYYGNDGSTDPAFTQGPSHTIADRFNQEFNEEGSPINSCWYLYDEVYDHHDSVGLVDWVLLRAESYLTTDAIYRDIIGNRIVQNPGEFGPFISGWGIYDVVHDRFMPVSGAMTGNYEGLAQAFDKVGTGRLLGDLDGDDSLTVIDATIMQRCEAKMCDYPAGDELAELIKSICYYSDFNRDGDRNILDATCVQRYLAGMSYPVG